MVNGLYSFCLCYRISLHSSFCFYVMFLEWNESVHENFDLPFKSEEMNGGVAEMVKHNTLRWFGPLDKMGGEELTKRVLLTRLHCLAANTKHEWHSLFTCNTSRGGWWLAVTRRSRPTWCTASSAQRHEPYTPPWTSRWDQSSESFNIWIVNKTAKIILRAYLTK